MLAIRSRIPDPKSIAPLQAICPWVDHIRPGIVLNKDGSLLAGFEFAGLDPDNADDAQINDAAERFQRAINQLDERYVMWLLVDKRRDSAYVPMNSENAGADALDARYARPFTAGKYYTMKYYLFVSFRGDTGTDKLFVRMARKQAEGVGLLKSFVQSFREGLSTKSAFLSDADGLFANLEIFERQIRSLQQSVPLEMTRLKAEEMETALFRIVNRASPTARIKKPQGRMLDSYIPINYFKISKDLLSFKSTSKTVYAGVMAVKDIPAETHPMMFEAIACMDMELTICHTIRFLGPLGTRKAIDAAVQFYKLTEVNPLQHLWATLKNEEADVEPGKHDQLLGCQDALRKFESDGICGANHCATIFCYDESIKQVGVAMDRVEKRLQELQISCYRERRNAGPSFAAMLPGQWSQQTRWDYIGIDSVADCAPLFTMPVGKMIHPYFSKELYSYPVPPLATFSTRYGTKINFVPHVEQVGHACIIAPNGGGKTTLVNFCISQFQRYPNSRSIIFDRNHSCLVSTKMHQGTYIDASLKKVHWNPLSVLVDGSEDGRTWCLEWILRRIKSDGSEVSSDELNELSARLADLQHSKLKAREKDKDARPPRLHDLVDTLMPSLRSRLQQWISGGAYDLFDSVEDDFSIGRWTTIEMKTILQQDAIARAFIDYAFRKIYSQLDGRPTFIYLEEASFLMADPAFAPVLDDWLKTFRKRGAFVWLTVQSPTSITNSAIATTILDNIPNLILCRNIKADTHRELYMKHFGVESHQVDKLLGLAPVGEYLLIQDKIARVLSARFPDDVLAMVRSEPKYIKLCLEHEASNDPNWREKYLKQAVAL